MDGKQEMLSTTSVCQVRKILSTTPKGKENQDMFVDPTGRTQLARYVLAMLSAGVNESMRTTQCAPHVLPPLNPGSGRSLRYLQEAGVFCDVPLNVPDLSRVSMGSTL